MAKLKIDVHDLHKYYGENEVLKGISTKFYEGDVVCIIGPSGSGKSTFLRSLNLLEEVTKGQITVKMCIRDRSNPEMSDLSTVA